MGEPSVSGSAQDPLRDTSRPNRGTLGLAIVATMLNGGPAVYLLSSDEYSMGMSGAFGGLLSALALLAAIAIALSLAGKRLAWVLLPLPLVSACLVLYVAARIVIAEGFG